MLRKVCNMCGKDFDEWDNQENFAIVSYLIGYGSKYDGSALRLDLCCDCMDMLIEKCKLNPLIERGGEVYSEE